MSRNFTLTKEENQQEQIDVALTAKNDCKILKHKVTGKINY